MNNFTYTSCLHPTYTDSPSTSPGYSRWINRVCDWCGAELIEGTWCGGSIDLLNANIAANRSTGRFKQQIVKTERMWSVERIARQSEELGDYDKFITPEENK